MDPTAILSLVDSIAAEMRANSEKIAQVSSQLRQIPVSFTTINIAEKGLNKIKANSTVMQHKMANVKEKVAAIGRQVEAGRKPDLSSLKQALEIQLEVAKLGNRQVDVVLKRLDEIAKG